MCRSRVAIGLLLHITLFLALYGGAGLATAARLKWDPITYVPLREVFPQEYRVLAAGLAVASCALIALGHLALTALCLARPALRRRLLLLYGIGMVGMLVLEAALVGWLGVQVRAFMDSPQAQELAEALEMRDHIRPLLQYLGKWHPMPTRLRELIDEAEADLPRNGYAAGGAAAALVLLQLAAAVLALMLATRTDDEHATDPALTTHYNESGERRSNSVIEETAPLRSGYRNGRLVMV